jgi:hypothetical protein
VAPHRAATAARAEEAGTVVAVHDTTLVEYSTQRRDLKYPPRTVARSTLRRHPERDARVARVGIASAQVTLKGTKYSGVKSEPFQVNVVRVWEPRPPKDQPAVEWILITTEDTSSPERAEARGRPLRLRWTIEEYFKALKTGCFLEKRQVESYDALRKVLALFVPIAYRLLLLRGLERLDASAPARRAFSEVDLHIMANAPSNRSLQAPRTVSDALKHLARLGGHIKNNPLALPTRRRRSRRTTSGVEASGHERTTRLGAMPAQGMVAFSKLACICTAPATRG